MRSPAEGPRWRDGAAPRCVVRWTSLHGRGREPGKRERSATASCAVGRPGTPGREREATRRAARCRKQRDPRWHTSRSDTRGDHDMHLRYALLALLAEGEAHGYQLLKLFNQRLGPFWHPNIGQVYQLLHELERRGLVVRRDQSFGTRLRRLFRLTPRGERALGTLLPRRPGARQRSGGEQGLERGEQPLGRVGSGGAQRMDPPPPRARSDNGSPVAGPRDVLVNVQGVGERRKPGGGLEPIPVACRLTVLEI